MQILTDRVPMMRTREDDWMGRKPSTAVRATSVAPYVLTDMTVTRASVEINMSAAPSPGAIIFPTVITLVTVAPSLSSSANSAPNGISHKADSTPPAYVQSTKGPSLVLGGK